MPPSVPTRIDEDLFAAAKSAGEVVGRSAAQQLNHWARIGRELETSSAVNARDIAIVLVGLACYDDLGAGEKAVVRAEWDERMAVMRTSLNLEDEFTAAGDTWVEADEQGRAVERGRQGNAAGPSPRRPRGVR